jgi:hypothetical protein
VRKAERAGRWTSRSIGRSGRPAGRRCQAGSLWQRLDLGHGLRSSAASWSRRSPGGRAEAYAARKAVSHAARGASEASPREAVQQRHPGSSAGAGRRRSESVTTAAPTDPDHGGDRSLSEEEGSSAAAGRHRAGRHGPEQHGSPKVSRRDPADPMTAGGRRRPGRPARRRGPCEIGRRPQTPAGQGLARAPWNIRGSRAEPTGQHDDGSAQSQAGHRARPR